MNHARALSLSVVVGCCALAASPAADRWWEHVKFLASDSLEGRNAGSGGHRKAAEYVAAQFERAGLKPLFNTSYLQPVTLRSRRVLRVELQDDPEPQRNLFVRSDHYNFVRQGIPAVFLKIGYKKGSPDERTQKAWTRDRYHAPSDDLAQPMDLEAAAKFTEIEAAIIREIGDAATRPTWNTTSFFRRFARP